MSEVLTGDIEPLTSGVIEPVEEEQFDADARAWAKVGQDPKWKVITDYCESRISFFRDDLGGMDLRGAPLSEVGEKYLVCSLVAQELVGLLEKVQATTEAVVESERKRS